MNRLRILLTLLLLSAPVLALSGTAEGNDAAIEFLQGPEPGAVLEGAHGVEVEARALILVSFRLSIVSADPRVEFSFSKDAPPTDNPLGLKTVENKISLSWDTYGLTRFNGTYRLVATARSQLDDTTGVDTVKEIGDLHVNNPPRAPTGVNAQSDGDAIAVSWAANSEPDLIRYSVARSVGGGPFDPLANVDKPAAKYRDESAPKGVDLRYQVTAARRAWNPDQTLSSPPSAATSPIQAQAPAAAGPEPAPGAGAAAAPAPIPTPRIIRGKNPAIPSGFNPVLPYTEPVPEDAPEVVQQADDGQQVQAAPPLRERAQAVLQVADKLKFYAAALVLLTLSLHVVRTSRRLFRGDQRVS
ncbi:MAG: hypothetical protein ACRDJ4_05175 [Actinomycetota bacterium]